MDNKYKFSAQIYKIGINWCVDVPTEVTNSLVMEKGRVNIKGAINGFHFTKTLMPVKNSLHRLYVNKEMMVGGQTALGEVATFEIQQDHNKIVQQYPTPNLLSQELYNNDLTECFKQLTPSKRRSILKYLSYIKKVETLVRNIEKLITQLKNNVKDVRVP